MDKKEIDSKTAVSLFQILFIATVMMYHLSTVLVYELLQKTIYNHDHLRMRIVSFKRSILNYIH